MTVDDLPSGGHRVCPRCGTAANEAVFCDGCGLNLKKHGKLPIDAYAAGVREQRWLATGGRAMGKRQGADRKRVKLAAVTTGLLVLLGGGIAAYTVLDDGSSEPSTAGTSPASRPPLESRTSDPTSDSIKSADGGGDCPPAEGVAPPNLSPGEGSGDAIAVEAIGTSCETAARLAEDYFPAETSQGVSPGEAVDVEGFTCSQIQGSGGSTVECEKGPEQVTFRIGDATVVPQGFEYCPLYETRDRGVFSAGVRGVDCSEAGDVLAQTVQTDAVVGDWTCDKEELAVCTSADLDAEIRYRLIVPE